MTRVGMPAASARARPGAPARFETTTRSAQASWPAAMRSMIACRLVPVPEMSAPAATTRSLRSLSEQPRRLQRTIRGSAAGAALPNGCSLLPPAATNTRRASRAPHLVGRRCACRSRSRLVRLARHHYPDGLLGRHLGDDLHHVERLDLVLELLRLDPVREHGHAERAGDGDHLGVGLEGLLGAQQVDALVRVLLDPHAPAARPAAHAELLVAVHLLHLGARPGEHRARLVVDLVEATVVAGVVVDRLLPELGRHLQAALRDQLRYQLGGVDDLVAAAELRELVLDGVEAMRAVDDDLLHARGIETLDARLRHGLVEVLVAETARGLAVAGLLLAEAGEVDARLLEQAGEGLGGLLVAVVEGAGAADVVEVLGVRLVGDGGYAEPLRPVEALLGAEAPRFRLRLHAFEGARQLVREAGSLLHQVAAHVDDLVDVLDHYRARLLARPAHVARP